MLKFTGHLFMYITYLYVAVKAGVGPRSKHIRWNGLCGCYSEWDLRMCGQHGRILPGLRCMSCCVRCAHHSSLWESIKVSKTHRDRRNCVMSFTLVLGLPTFITSLLSCQIMNLGYSISGYGSTRRGKPYKRQWEPHKRRDRQMSRIALSSVRTSV